MNFIEPFEDHGHLFDQRRLDTDLELFKFFAQRIPDDQGGGRCAVVGCHPNRIAGDESAFPKNLRVHSFEGRRFDVQENFNSRSFHSGSSGLSSAAVPGHPVCEATVFDVLHHSACTVLTISLR